MASGHIRKRVSKESKVSYQLIVEGDSDPITGKRDRHYKTVHGTKKNAEATLRKMIDEIEHGTVVNNVSTKLEDWIIHWFDTYCIDKSPSTKAGYKEKMHSYIIPGLGSIQLKALNTDHVQTWINQLIKRGLAPKTIRNAYNVLNPALKQATVLRMISYNPCTGVKLPKLKKYHATVYDDSDIQAVLKAAKGTDMYLFFILDLTTGLRRGEIAALKWQHIDFKNNTLTVVANRTRADGQVIEKAPKSESGKRTISLGDSTISILKEAKENYVDEAARKRASFKNLGYVVHTRDGSPYSPDSLTQKWSRFLKKHGLNRIRLHDLRHTHATMLIQAGVSAKVVQTRLGHSDVSITLNTYTHVLPQMDQAATATIDKIVF